MLSCSLPSPSILNPKSYTRSCFLLTSASKPEWTPEVVDGRVASKLPKKKTTPHSDTKTAPVLKTIETTTSPCKDALRGALKARADRRPGTGSLALS